MAIDHAIVTDDQLRYAEAIHTVDPQDHNAAGHQLWGIESAASQPALARKSLEVALPSDDHFALLHLISRIEQVKGSLPPDVEVLRKNLAS